MAKVDVPCIWVEAIEHEMWLVLNVDDGRLVIDHVEEIEFKETLRDYFVPRPQALKAANELNPTTVGYLAHRGLP